MITGKRGIAGLFDALIFLAIASVVSVALLSAFAPQTLGPLGKEQERVEAAHTVLLRSTVFDEAGNSHTVEELFKTGAVQGGEYDGRLRDVLDHLLPGMAWRWTVLSDEGAFALGTTDVPGKGVPLFCSLVHAPMGGEVVDFRLVAWSL